MLFVVAGHIPEMGAWVGRRLEVDYRYCMLVGGKEHRSLVVGMVHRIDLVVEHHIDLMGPHRAVVGIDHVVQHTVVVVGIDQEGVRRKAVVVGDSLVEERIDWVVHHKAVVVAGSLAEEGGSGRSLAAWILRDCQLAPKWHPGTNTNGRVGERHREADNHFGCMPFCLLTCDPLCCKMSI
jgi:hypothetical protein